MKIDAQQPHQRTEPWAVATALHTHRQHGGGDGAAAGAAQPVQLVLDHKRHNCRDLHHLVAQRLRIVT